MSAAGLPDQSGCADPVVQCRGVGVTRGGVGVLGGIDLVARRGEWLAVVGPNGAGKTTFLHALAGLVPATGHLRVAGLDPRCGRRRVARVVALMPQRPVVPDGVTVAELVGLGRTPHLRRFAGETGHDRAVVRRVLARLDLDGFAARDAADLSGGELQRVVLARALAQEPRVLLLDEPTSALDVGHQQSVLDLVDDLRRQDGTTVVAAMHDLTLAGQYAERTVLLDGGRVVADGPPAAVLTAQRLREVYGARVDVLALPCGPAVVPVRATPATPCPVPPTPSTPDLAPPTRPTAAPSRHPSRTAAPTGGTA